MEGRENGMTRLASRTISKEWFGLGVVIEL